eukprot:439044-Rhodomonas_salina.2
MDGALSLLCREQTLLSEAEEESGRLGQELRQQESARLVLLEEFETEKQKLQTEFDRRQLALERKVGSDALVFCCGGMVVV